ncbi:MAG: aminotransferase class V-fold PLP-dependent enzyme [Xanthobacteraceae bacterium]
MLPSQRPLFDIPSDVCYLNAASYTPLPLATLEAGRAAVGRKGRPWLIDNDFAAQQYSRTRQAAARLIRADAADVALIPSISYGVATVAKIIPVPAGSRVIVLHDDHSSPLLEWLTRARDGAFTVDTVQGPNDHDWTSAVLSTIERAGAAPVAIVSISSVHWADGAATQGAGVLDLDVCALDPDFVVFPTCKWLLGPYGRAFIYVAKRHQGGIPLEQTSYGRKAVRAEQDVYFTDTDYVTDARRFDMGERDHFISMEMASIGMEMMADWGAEPIATRLGALTERLAQQLGDATRAGRISFPASEVRSPHILSLGFPGGVPKGLTESLAAQKIYVAPRRGRLRVSPHVYNDDADIDRFAQALLAAIR